jgi:hypothetical protein
MELVVLPRVGDVYNAVIVISEAGVGAEFAVYFFNEGSNFFSKSSGEVVCYVIAGQDDDIRREMIYAVDALGEVFCADGS